MLLRVYNRANRVMARRKRVFLIKYLKCIEARESVSLGSYTQEISS